MLLAELEYGALLPPPHPRSLLLPPPPPPRGAGLPWTLWMSPMTTKVMRMASAAGGTSSPYALYYL